MIHRSIEIAEINRSVVNDDPVCDAAKGVVAIRPQVIDGVLVLATQHELIQNRRQPEVKASREGMSGPLVVIAKQNKTTAARRLDAAVSVAVSPVVNQEKPRLKSVFNQIIEWWDKELSIDAKSVGDFVKLYQVLRNAAAAHGPIALARVSRAGLPSLDSQR